MDIQRQDFNPNTLNCLSVSAGLSDQRPVEGFAPDTQLICIVPCGSLVGLFPPRLNISPITVLPVVGVLSVGSRKGSSDYGDQCGEFEYVSQQQEEEEEKEV